MTEDDLTIRLDANSQGSPVCVITSQPSSVIVLFAVDVNVAELDATPFELIPIEPKSDRGGTSPLSGGRDEL